MPTTRSEKIYIDGPRDIFARVVTKKITSWTLGELMDAANVPADVKIMPTHDYGDSDITPYRRDDEVCQRIEMFDEKGRPVQKVQKKREVTRTVWYDEFELIPEAPNVQATETLVTSEPARMDGHNA